MYLLLFANFFLGGPEVLDLQFRNAQKVPLCLRKKGPPWNTLEHQILIDFQNFSTVGKRIKFTTKRMQHYPSQLKYVATPAWEIENSNFLCIFNRYGKKSNI